MIYLDNSTTSRPSSEAVSAMMPYLTDRWGTPSAPHQKGQQLFPALKESYRALYDLFGASDQDTVLFTSSGAEAVNHVFSSAYHEVTVPTGKNHFIVCKTDEAPALMAQHKLQDYGCVSKVIEVDSLGQLNVKKIGDAITSRTALISLSWGNGLTGVVQPVAEIARLCKERGILFHLEASHTLGKIYFDPTEVGADLISFNGDTLHAPQGTGALFAKKGVKMAPFIAGGMEQAGLRAGPLNIPALVALGVAARQALDARDLLCTEGARLRSRLEAGIKMRYPEAVIFFEEQERLPTISCMGFPGIANEALLFLLSRQGLCAGIGGGSFQQIGLLLTACGVEESLAHAAISFSLSRETTEDEVDHAAEKIAACAKQLRKISYGI